MILKEALNRLKYTIGNENKPNKNDKIAFNSVLNFVNLSNEKAIQENLLFAKLYVLVLNEFSNNYQNIDFANKQLNKELSKDIVVSIQKLTSDLKQIQLHNFLKSKGIKDSWNDNLSLIDAIETSRKKEIKIIENKETIFKNNEILNKINIEEMLSEYDYFDFDSVLANVNFSINQSIQNYKN